MHRRVIAMLPLLGIDSHAYPVSSAFVTYSRSSFVKFHKTPRRRTFTTGTKFQLSILHRKLSAGGSTREFSSAQNGHLLLPRLAFHNRKPQPFLVPQKCKYLSDNRRPFSRANSSTLQFRVLLQHVLAHHFHPKISPQDGAHQDISALIIHHRKAVVLTRVQGVKHGARSLQGSQAAHSPRHGLGGRHIVLFGHGGTLVLKERKLRRKEDDTRHPKQGGRTGGFAGKAVGFENGKGIFS